MSTKLSDYRKTLSNFRDRDKIDRVASMLLVEKLLPDRGRIFAIIYPYL
ncbi:hypothetical protein [Chamaesiphon minutus]|nr:hypothetical protein [Chamaesiphon minutus]